jgi:outer membrane protein OmpA-like peptidoglycan-associated protein
MNKYYNSFIMFFSVFLFSITALSQQSYKLEYGAAQPLTKPQSERFYTGGSVAVKGFTELTPFFDLGLSASFLGLPSELSGVKAGTAFGGGLSLRVKSSKDNTFVTWADTDLQVVQTGPLTRFSPSFAVGLSAPANESQSVRLGPFVRYQHVLQLDKQGYDTTDARVLIVGVSLEFGEGVQPQKEVAVAVAEKQPEPDKVIEVPPDQPDKPIRVPASKTFELATRVQFAKDSAVLSPQAKEVLKEVVSTAKEVLKEEISTVSQYVDWSLRIEGHASSEGPPEPYNQKLSERRAKAVLSYLKDAGVPEDNMTATGYSYNVPVASNETEPGRILNRRVQFVVNFSLKQ